MLRCQIFSDICNATLQDLLWHLHTLDSMLSGRLSHLHTLDATLSDLPWHLQVFLLPRKTNLRCSKCCACHAKRAGGAPSAAPATQNDPAPKVITRRRTSADLYEGAPSAAPCHAKTNLRCSNCLPRKTSRRCSKCCACHAKRRGAQSHHSSPDFRSPL